MSNGYNRVTLFGNLGTDPELRKLRTGDLLKLRLATSHSWVNKEGERNERVEWHQVVLWGNRAEGLARILQKGSFVLVDGEIRTRSYEKDGEKRYTTEVYAFDVVLGGRRRSDPTTNGAHGAPTEVPVMEGAQAPVEDRGEFGFPTDRGETFDDQDGPEPEVLDPDTQTPKPPQSGEGGAADSPPPPRPPRKRTRSPEPAFVSAA